MNTTASPYTESSWSSTLQNYRKSTTSLPWAADQFNPTKRETIYEKSRQEREFNPILMKYRDDKKENVINQREQSFAAVRLNDAKDKQLCFEQKFDIINHVSHLPKRYEEDSRKAKMMEVIKRRAPDTRLKYNLISHMNHDEHGKSKMVPNENEEFTLRRTMNTTLEGGLQPKSHQQREFDVLSNKYHANNTARALDDRSREREVLTEKYWKAHDYDIVGGKYCDGNKEGLYEEGLRAKERVHGNRQRARLPPSVKYSEGKVYDILNNEIRNGNAINSVDEKRNRSVSSKKTSVIEEQVRTKALQSADLTETRSHNRIHPSRYQIDRKLGYDPITNISHEGRNGVKPAPLRQAPVKPVWTKLHNDQNNVNYSKNDGGASGGGVMKPRDLSGGHGSSNNNGNNNNNNGNGGGQQGGGSKSELNPKFRVVNKTIRPDFVPGLSIPLGGMVDGKLDIVKK